MRYLLSLGAHVTIMCSDPSPEEFKNSFGVELEREGFQVIPIAKKGYANLQTIATFRRQLRMLDKRDPIDFIYIRNFWNILTVPSRKIKVVFDLRGANLEETEFRSIRRRGTLRKIKAGIYRYFERKAVQRANYLQCVSYPLKEYSHDRFQRDDAMVVNSCVEKNRFQGCRNSRERIRTSFGIKPEDIVFLYLGGLDSYQELDYMLLLWIEISKRIDSPFFLLYTSNEPKNKPLLDSLPKDRLTIRSIPYEKIPEFVSAADFGFLLRQDIVLNRVASPTKFPEYLSAGLGVITTPGIGDISRLVEECKIGCLVELGDLAGGVKKILGLVEQFKHERSLFAERAQEIAARHFLWDSYKDYFIERYFNGSSIGGTDLQELGSDISEGTAATTAQRTS